MHDPPMGAIFTEEFHYLVIISTVLVIRHSLHIFIIHIS